MSNIESNRDVHFSEYPSDERSPAQVTAQTCSAIDMYFSADIPDKSPIQQYLRTETLPFIRRVQKGFLSRVEKVDRLGLIEDHDRAIIDRRRSMYGADPITPLEHESFDYALVVMNAIPDYARHKYLENGFSRRATMRPPSTAKQFLRRVDELGSVITQMAAGQTDTNGFIELDTSLWRTSLFFEVGNQLPPYFKDEPKIIHQESRQYLDRLLWDVDINL